VGADRRGEHAPADLPARAGHELHQHLHLNSTYFSTSASFCGRYAHGYYPPSFTGAGYLDTSAWSPSIEWAAGALISNAADLARFYQALLSGHLLSPPLLREMTTTFTTPAYPGYGMGLGIFSIDTPCCAAWGHQGGTPAT
jgi:D-alanyl-D-alanine carboxypeptidase